MKDGLKYRKVPHFSRRIDEGQSGVLLPKRRRRDALVAVHVLPAQLRDYEIAVGLHGVAGIDELPVVAVEPGDAWPGVALGLAGQDHGRAHLDDVERPVARDHRLAEARALRAGGCAVVTTYTYTDTSIRLHTHNRASRVYVLRASSLSNQEHTHIATIEEERARVPGPL